MPHSSITQLPTRRKFLRRAIQGAVGIATTTAVVGAYGVLESSMIQHHRATITVPNLPLAFRGQTLAVLADFHYGPYTGVAYLRKIVELTKALSPDAIALVGDFAHKGHKTTEQLPPCLEALSELEAPLECSQCWATMTCRRMGPCIAATPLQDVTNRSIRVRLDGQHVWFAGVDESCAASPHKTRRSMASRKQPQLSC